MERRKMMIKGAALLLITSIGVFSCFYGNNNMKAMAAANTSSDVPVPPSNGGNPPEPPNNGGNTEVTGTAAYTQTGGDVTKTSRLITAGDANESAVKVTNSGVLKLYNSTIKKTAGDTTSEDSSNFYGLNAGILGISASQLTLDNDYVETNADGANGIFSTGSGSIINVSNSTVSTSKNSSRGLDATQGGTINANNVKIATKGAHCADLATDRGGGTVIAKNVTGTTEGEGSPGIYCTGSISSEDSNFTASGSEAAVIEGKNSITLTNTNITGSVNRGVMLYQSFSGDAEVGKSKFTMTGGSITALNGPLFYATNTNTVVSLKGAKFTNPSGILLEAASDRWGTTGSNGATVVFNADSEALNGSIIANSISSITAVLSNNTTYTGAINTSNALTNISLSLDKTSHWNVTGTSYVGALTDSDTTFSNIKDNGNTIYYNSSANTALKGKTYTLQGGGKLVPVSTANTTKDK